MFLLKYFYLYPAILLVLIYTIMYNPATKLAKKENKKWDEYKKVTLAFLIVSFIPIINLLLLFAIMASLIERYIKNMNSRNFQ